MTCTSDASDVDDDAFIIRTRALPVLASLSLSVTAHPLPTSEPFVSKEHTTHTQCTHAQAARLSRQRQSGVREID